MTHFAAKKNVPCNYLAEKKNITYFLQLQRAFGLRNLETIPSSLLSDFFLSKSTFCGGGRTKTEVAGWFGVRFRNPKLDFGIFSHVGFIAFCPRSRWYKVDHWDRISPCKPRQTKKHKIPTVAKKISKNQKISEAFLRTRSCFSLGFILIQLKNLSDGRWIRLNLCRSPS